MSQTATLRTLIQSPDLLVMPGIFDGFSARLVEHSGFAAGFISGAGLSETLLGWSDVGLMGFELNLAAVTRLAACCPLPLLAEGARGLRRAPRSRFCHDGTHGCLCDPRAAGSAAPPHPLRGGGGRPPLCRRASVGTRQS